MGRVNEAEVVVVFAGHGRLEDDGRLLLELREGAVPLRDLVGWLAAGLDEVHPGADHDTPVAVLLDACHAGQAPCAGGHMPAISAPPDR